MGMVMEIEATAKKINFRKGNLSITGLVEEEEINSSNKKQLEKVLHGVLFKMLLL